MIDIYQIIEGKDLGVAESTLPKAVNVVSIQLGDLEYAPDFGIDKRYFLTSDISIQRDSYRAHVVQRLTESKIAVMEMIELLNALSSTNRIAIGNRYDSAKGLIR